MGNVWFDDKMAFVSLKDFFARLGLVTPEQFDEHSKAWRVAAESGSQETLMAFICRERGMAEDVYLQKLSQALNWPYLEMAKLEVPAPARTKISTKSEEHTSELQSLRHLVCR